MDGQAAGSGGCARCDELGHQLAGLKAQVAVLQAQLAAATKTSATSSKPPSSDIVKPKSKPKRKRTKRRRGAQPGHPKHDRPPFEPEQVTRIEEHDLDACPQCGGTLEVIGEPVSVLQQIEVPVQPAQIIEHRSRVCRCGKCNREFTQPIPREVRAAGLVGPQLTALVAYLKGACHCSFSTIRKFVRDVLKVALSRGQLRKLCAKVADSLQAAYQQLLDALPKERRLNIDETGHKENGQALWTWCFRAPLFTLFKIEPSRGSDVLIERLGTEFDGVIGCDYFSAYRKYMRLNDHVLVQFCLAHLIRDVKYLVEHPNSKNRAYGTRVLAALRELFKIIHCRAEYRSEADFRGALEDQGFEVWTQAIYRTPRTSEAQNLAKRFENHGNQYIQFITTPDIDPTNNLAEQAIRFVVIDRKVTQGTRSAAGRTWCERIWTTIATCTQHGRDLLAFLIESVQALFTGADPPSLLPESP